MTPFGIKLALLGLLLVLGGKVYAGKPKLLNAFDPIFRDYADNPKLAKAVAMVESSLNPNAMGDQGRAFGLMQIWYPTAQGHGYAGTPYGLLDPEVNIYYATRELNHLVSKYGLERGVMGYNVGETKLRKGITNPTYLNKVLKFYEGVTV